MFIYIISGIIIGFIILAIIGDRVIPEIKDDEHKNGIDELNTIITIQQLIDAIKPYTNKAIIIEVGLCRGVVDIYLRGESIPIIKSKITHRLPIFINVKFHDIGNGENYINDIEYFKSF